MKKFGFSVGTIALLLILSCCNSYRQISVDKNDFYNNNKIPRKINSYDVYVHEGSNLYRMANRSFVNDTLKGDLEPVSSASVNAHPEKKSELRAARNDMHIYLSKNTTDIVASPDQAAAVVKTVAIDREDIDRVDMFAKDERTGFRLFGYIFALVVIGMLLVYAIIASLINASGEAANGSDSNSNSGDSGSGDSGGSNSGGSDSNSGDSGGSDSGGSDSGCYVATMVYGSYEAPNVLTLRTFRDQFLQRFGWGRRFISWYYANSPRFVEKHKNKAFLGMIIRSCLNVFVWCIRPVYGKRS